MQIIIQFDHCGEPSFFCKGASTTPAPGDRALRGSWGQFLQIFCADLKWVHIYKWRTLTAFNTVMRAIRQRCWWHCSCAQADSSAAQPRHLAGGCGADLSVTVIQV